MMAINIHDGNFVITPVMDHMMGPNHDIVQQAKTIPFPGEVETYTWPAITTWG